MSKNTNSGGFRKIDIDRYDPENYDDEDSSMTQAEDIGPNENEIVGLLNT
jgi:hypothetical protein